VSSFEQLSALVMVGTNVRFEASLLNTLLRKQQNMRALPYITFSSFSPLRLKQNHIGNSLRSLISFVENRQKLATNFYNISNPSIILGAETLKGKTSFMLQNITRFLGKKFFVKTKTGDRLSVLHSNVTSLAFSYLGIDAGVRSSFHVDSIRDKKIDTLFSIQNSEINNTK
jgi:NADH-quinone oxidoreductase subunit G